MQRSKATSHPQAMDRPEPERQQTAPAWQERHDVVDSRHQDGDSNTKFSRDL